MNPMKKLQDAGVTIVQEPLVAEAAATGDTGVVALLTAEFNDDEYDYTLSLHENLSSEDIEKIVEWADQRIDGLQRHGPEDEKWVEDEDGILELWLHWSEQDSR